LLNNDLASLFHM